ncbi:unnamed protein product [Trichogramma brassicae]|uniref:Uncharacterized protein n=1 Tax=Trichogramma brassicae TaxID=86971 RepID=A0A6H5IU22_9HYME|nr:unnamed protein product [Trichogramma brassicae]
MDTYEDGSTASFDGQKNLETLKSLQKNTNWEIVDERRKFIRQVYPIIKQWNRRSSPNVQDVFRAEDVERLAMDYINFTSSIYRDKEYVREIEEFIVFLCITDYKDEPKLNGDGKPSSRRTTPVHHAAKQDRDLVGQLFEIYNRYDVNYTDESGLSHFHVVCMYGQYQEIKKFLEFGHDPNCLWSETGDSPLGLAVLGSCTKHVVELLLRSGANPNLPNKEGLNLLHIISKKFRTQFIEVPDVPKILFEISDELNQSLQIDARDEFGNTPLHLAVLNDNVYVTEMLLRRGANPNSANDEGSTPLHLFYMRKCSYYDIGSVEFFFKICDELNHLIQTPIYTCSSRTARGGARRYEILARAPSAAATSRIAAIWVFRTLRVPL